jgi:hypothetical protein
MNTDLLDKSDPVYRRFMERQLQDALELEHSSDLIRLHIPPMAPPHVVAEFRCTGLIREPDYLRRADAFEMLRMFTPNVWHPNVSREHPLICIGRLTPGTTLVDILYQCFDILTFQKYNPREDDCMNKTACAWARENHDRFPIDRRPLKRRPLDLEVEPL